MNSHAQSDRSLWLIIILAVLALMALFSRPASYVTWSSAMTSDFAAIIGIGFLVVLLFLLFTAHQHLGF